jgi:outer membrane lipoprotein-sorting protein
MNTARVPNIKHDSPEIKEVVDFADRLWYVFELKIKKLRLAMQKSNIRGESDTLMIRIQALEWVQGRIQDIILNNVTIDWPVYDT